MSSRAIQEHRPVGASAGLDAFVMAGLLCFVAAVVVMHWIQPDLSPIDDAVSYYMNGRLGWVLGAGLMALGIGSLCLWHSLGGLLPPRDVRLGMWSLAAWSIGAVIGGVFPPDPRGHWNEPPPYRGWSMPMPRSSHSSHFP